MPLRIAFATLALFATSAPARAATLTWGSGGAGGTGNWDTTTSNWYDGATDVPWSNAAPDSAVFAGTAGTVTLTEGITAGGLTFSTSGYTVTSGTLTLAGSTPTVTVNSGLSATVASVLSATTLAKSGAGTLTLSGSISLSGATTVNSGTLRLSGAGSMGDIGLAGSTALVAATGANVTMGTLNSSGLSASLTIESGATLTSSGFSNGWQFAGITTNGTWNVTGNMLLSIFNPTTIAGSGTVNAGTLTNANSTTATFTVSRLNIGSGGIVNSGGGAINFNGSTVGASANWSSSASLTLQQTTTFNTLDSADGSTARTITLSGVVGGSGALVKAGAGTLTLQATNNYSGGTVVNQGTVVVAGPSPFNSSSNLGSGTVTINSGATLQANAVHQFGWNAGSWNNFAVNSGTFAIGGNDNYIGSLSLTENAALTGSGYVGISTGTLTYSGTTASSQATIASRLVLASPQGNVNATLTVNGFNSNGDLVVSNAISGGRLTKSGTGTLRLTAANSYTGGTVVDQGTLVVAGPANFTVSNLGTGTVTINSGATLQATNVHQFGWNTGSWNNFVINDSGTFAIGGNDNYIGSLALTDNAAITGSGRVGLATGTITYTGNSAAKQATISSQLNLQSSPSGAAVTANFAVNGSNPAGDLVISGVANGNGGLTKSGTGILRLSASNTYVGNTTISRGTVVAANSNAFGTTGAVTLNDASTGSGNASLLIDASGGTVTISRPITVASQGTGTATIGSSANAGGNFATFSGAITLAKDVTLYGVATGDRTQFTGGIGGTGNVTVTTAAGGRVLFDTAANTYSGSTTITAGSNLQLGAASGAGVNMLPDSSTVTVIGTLSFAKGGGSETIDALRGGGTVQSISGADTLVVGSAGGSGTFSGILRDNGSTLTVSKSGAGTQVLTGSNSYTGGTTINAGRLTAGHASALGTSGAITINSGGTLGIADGITFSRPLTINAGGKVFTGNNSTVALPSAAALSAWESENTAGGDQTYASILSGSGSTVPSALTTAWTSNPNTSAYLSDILTLEGTGTSNVYVLSMTYRSIFGDMNIWYRDDVSSPFTPLGTSSQGNVAWNSSFATVGQYGLDTTAGTVWVVTDHNSQFVVVPEPGTLALAGIGLAAAGLAAARRRRRRR